MLCPHEIFAGPRRVWGLERDEDGKCVGGTTQKGNREGNHQAYEPQMM